MEPQDCFSILTFVIMLDNDIIVLPLVIKPSLLTCYLSQGSVSVILTLVYPCCGIWHIEGQNVFAYPTFYICMLLTYLVSCPGWIHVCLHVLYFWPDRMRTCFFMRGECVTHWEFRFFSGFQVNWCHLRN